MKKPFSILLLAAMLLSIILPTGAFAEGLTIGVTLHPYFSWVKNIVGNKATVTPIIPEDADPHMYQPRPEDIEKLAAMDAVVINGLGHDAFFKPMLKASNKKDLFLIDTHIGLPLIPVFTSGSDKKSSKPAAYNNHTYVSITTSIQQINTITKGIAKLDGTNAKTFKTNARAYIKRLRRLLGAALSKINETDLDALRIATVHDGYSYLLRELGISIATVIQPRHGIEPSPKQLQDTINRLKEAKVNILFAEMDYAKKYVDIIYKATGCKIYKLSHISNGPYSAELFENKISENLDTITKALTNE